MSDYDITEIWRSTEYKDGEVFQHKVINFARAIIAARDEELRERMCDTPVLLDGHHPFTALNIQMMMINAIDAPIPPEPIRKDLVLVPRELIDAAKNLIAVKGRHHTELAYKQLCQALANCEGSKP